MSSDNDMGLVQCRIGIDLLQGRRRLDMRCQNFWAISLELVSLDVHEPRRHPGLLPFRVSFHYASHYARP